MQGVKFPYIRNFIFAYAEIYFRAHRNKFPSARKYFFFRKEINFLAEGNFSPCGRGILSLRKGRLFRSKGREFLFGQKLPALRKEGNFPSKENNFSKAEKLLFQAWKVYRLGQSARAASAEAEAHKRRSPRVSRRAYSGAFAWRRALEGEGDGLRRERSLASEGEGDSL